MPAPDDDNGRLTADNGGHAPYPRFFRLFRAERVDIGGEHWRGDKEKFKREEGIKVTFFEFNAERMGRRMIV